MTSPYTLTISRNTLEHLGINLYSNVPAVLSEIVANAWDADASKVSIHFDIDQDRIVVQDDGSGMLLEDINERFLTVGYRRREGQPGKTPAGRYPMGRKGIGKLSLFAIAEVIQIETAKGGTRNAFEMRLEDILKRVTPGEIDLGYHPNPLPTEEIDFDHGTKLTLTRLRKQHTIRTTHYLKRRIARRFAVLGAEFDFSVSVNNQLVRIEDRGYFDKLQFVWTYGDDEEIRRLAPQAEFHPRGNIATESGIQLRGWVGTVFESKQLKDEHGENINQIALFVRKKVAQEDVLGQFAERGVYVGYLVGELYADELDTFQGDDATLDEDSATSSRQQIKEDDSRYVEISVILRNELKHIETRWSELRTREGAAKAREIPEVREWIDALGRDDRKRAERWVGKLNQLPADKFPEQKELIKHAVIAFEFHRAQANLDALDEVTADSLENVLEIFRDLDGLETSLYGQVVKQRVGIIRTLQQKVDANEKERAIQQYIFEHLWLLDPSWERIQSTAIMETRMDKVFADVDATLTEDEKLSRLDIKYRKSSGTHIVIELKRPERVVGLDELHSQIGKYRSGMLKLFAEMKESHPSVAYIVLVGKEPRDLSGVPNISEVRDAMDKAYGARVMFYNELLKTAEESYNDYLARREDVDKLSKLFAAIDEFSPETPQAS